MMGVHVLACGPYFAPGGVEASLLIFLVLKPLAYYAFIQAFRYRVNRPIPMSFGKAAKLAALRAGIGVLLVGLGAAALAGIGSDRLWRLSWIYLYGERLFARWVVGAYGAGLVGRRLLGWTIGGTAVNAAFDLAVLARITEGWLYPLVICAPIGVFIYVLHVVGRRDLLRARFPTYPLCWKCQYNLTGNISGICPECGTPVTVSTAATG
jgi:hypothetical protein